MKSRIAGCGLNAHAPQGDLSRLESQLERISEIGADVVELSAATLDCVAAGRLIAPRVAATRAILDRFSIRRSLHLPIPINLMDRDHTDLHKRASKTGLELAGALGAEICVLHPGRVPPAVWLEQQNTLLAFERNMLAELGDLAQMAGTRIAYENISPNPKIMAGLETSYALDPRRLAEQLQRLDHPAVTGCLDISHAQQGAGLWGFDMIDACKAMAPVTGHLHFSDSTGEPMRLDLGDHSEHLHWFGVGDMHAPPGWGSIDFDRLASALKPREGSLLIIELRANVRSHADADSLQAAKQFSNIINQAQTFNKSIS